MTLSWRTAPSGTHCAFAPTGEQLGTVQPRQFYDDKKGFDVYAVAGKPGGLIRWPIWLGHFAELEPARWRLEEHAAIGGTKNAIDPIESLI